MNENSNFYIRRVAVLGAGVMGAQIAAHLANADVPVILFDLPAKEGDKNGIVKKALDGLKKLQPDPLATRDRAARIEAANYEQHLDRLKDCDLIIEAIAEKMEWKDDLYRKIAPFISAKTIIASNTSGLSINRLAEALPATLRPNFCGIHFFNPPRYMHLVEIIATRDSAAGTLDQLETWLVSRLGKGVVRAKDTPNFVANRVGVFSMLAVMHHTEKFGLGFDEVDALTGPLIGRPKSATYRTADVVGLDTLAHVVKTMQDTLPNDPWHGFFEAPEWLAGLIGQGALGQKTKAGVFRKEGKAIKVLDPLARVYRDASGVAAPELVDILKQPDPAQRFAQLRASQHPQAQFLWAIFRDVFHYCAYHLADIADNARDLDFAMRWGFGWSQGPFETWQAAGWSEIAGAIAADIEAGKAMVAAPLPAWVAGDALRSSQGDSLRSQNNPGNAAFGVHHAAGSYSAAEQSFKPRSTLPVYRRQLFPERVIGEVQELGTTLWENAGVRLWNLPQLDAGIAIVSVRTKGHTLGRDVVVGLQEAIRRAEASYQGLVIWHEAPFAFGANLKEVMTAVAAGDFDLLDRFVGEFQNTGMMLKYAQVPTVAAVQGMALGGGCEFQMQCAARVLALESYIGLVEAGVGLIPAGGGSKEFALRAAELAKATATPGEVFPYIQPAFQTIATAGVAKSALNAIEMGFCKPGDTVLFNAHELLYVAIRKARALFEAGYYPALPAQDVVVAGRTGIANAEMMLTNMLAGGMISAHDYRVSKAAATALCGGDVEAGSK
ncbi:MAG TPA: 3-hydroxyacyl-CoA dehydrogenase/enoyl-CoA hydratase family protein, partial [Rhodocyclaceae bacterium]|nr:3-hydroxyacyl-CoA dehydrogenase/enoyl-CoA hydratase family protein [Rhodocyclaceae bacterium]